MSIDGRHRLTGLLFVALLVGCGAPPVGSVPGTPAASSRFEASTVTPVVTSSSTLAPAATLTPEATVIADIPPLPAGWRRVTWQDLSIPLPPDALGINSLPTNAIDQSQAVPVHVVGVVDFPPPPTPTGGAIGEYPDPPRLTVVHFAGTLDEWVALEETSRAAAEGGVVEPVERRTIAGREAIHYQSTVPGFNYNDYYVVKLTDTTLLWIYTDQATYGVMVDGLTITAP